MKKHCIFLILSSVYLTAEQTTPSSTTPPRGIITPVVTKAPNGIGAFIDADFTWWKSKVLGMSFAEIDQRIVSPSSAFRPGFKLGFGIDLDYDGWDVYGEYTWFYQPWNTNHTSSQDEISYSSFVQINTSSGALSSMILADATSSRKEQFNIIDLELGRNFFISRHLTLRPLFGLKLARMLERTHLFERQEGEHGYAKEFLSQTLSGVGIRGGINTFWHITHSFGLYADIALTALWSRIHHHFDSYFYDDFILTRRFNKLSTQMILPVIELGLGVAYETWLYQECYQLYAKAGWEEQVWVGYNCNIPSGQLNNTGNLSLQGLTAKLGFAF